MIDGTKFVAAAVGYAGDAWDILETRGAKIRHALPFGSVLTLPATGSEMNHSGVVTRRATQAKLPFRSAHVFPQFSILDPTKTQTLPVRQLANGVVDAFVHVMEQYLTYPIDARVQDRFAEGLLQTLIEIGPLMLEESADYSTRANLMWTATLALNGLIGAGVPQDWSTHMIGHELTALHGIDHARWPSCCPRTWKFVVKPSAPSCCNTPSGFGRSARATKNSGLTPPPNRPGRSSRASAYRRAYRPTSLVLTPSLR